MLFISLKLTETYFKAQVRIIKSDDLQHNEYNCNIRFKSAILLCRSKGPQCDASTVLLRSAKRQFTLLL